MGERISCAGSVSDGCGAMVQRAQPDQKIMRVVGFAGARIDHRRLLATVSGWRRRELLYVSAAVTPGWEPAEAIPSV